MPYIFSPKCFINLKFTEHLLQARHYAEDIAVRKIDRTATFMEAKQKDTLGMLERKWLERNPTPYLSPLANIITLPYYNVFIVTSKTPGIKFLFSLRNLVAPVFSL